MTPHAPRHTRRALAQPSSWKIARLVLAGGVLVGIGAGATTAAWTDSSWFTATATTPTIQLQAGNVPGTFVNADGTAQYPAVTIPSTAFANLAPSVGSQATVALKNTSTVPLIVPAPTVAWSGGFATAGSCALAPVTTATVTGGWPITLAANATSANIVVTVTPPASWNGSSTCQNQSGTLTLTFTGSTS